MKTFNDWYELAKEYYEAHGDLNVPCDYVASDGSKLAYWLIKMRGRHAHNPSYKGVLSPEQAKMLEEICIEWKFEREDDYSIENCRTVEDFKRHRELYLLGTFSDTPLYDAVLDAYGESPSIYAVAKKYGVKTQTVRKILITAGLYSSDTQRKIQELFDAGLSIIEIATKLKKSASVVDSYLPITIAYGRASAHKEQASEVDDSPEEAELITKELVERVADDYVAGESLRSLSKRYEFSKRKIVKLLITAGVYSSERSDEIHDLIDAGKTPVEIAEILGLTVPAVNTYLPYKYAAYNTGGGSVYVEHGKKYRRKVKARQELQKARGTPEFKKKVHDNILLFEGSYVKIGDYKDYYKLEGDTLYFRYYGTLSWEEIESALDGGECSPVIHGLFELIGVLEGGTA